MFVSYKTVRRRDRPRGAVLYQEKAADGVLKGNC